MCYGRGFGTLREIGSFLRFYQTVTVRMMRDSSKNHKLISGDDEKKILTKKIFLTPLGPIFDFGLYGKSAILAYMSYFEG